MSHNPIIGVDIDGPNVRIGKVQTDRIVAHNSFKLSAEESQTTTIEEIIQGIESLFDEHILGIGIGVPGTVNIERGIVYEVSRIPSWKEVPLKDLLEEHFNKPVYINNDANCFAVGEKYFGKARKYPNAIGLIIGEGYGAGVIIDNKLFSGYNCGAGEFGNIGYRNHSYENYCSAQFFLHEYDCEFECILDRANNNDTWAIEVLENYGMHLANAIQTIIFAIDPDIVVLGGVVSKAYPFFKRKLWEQLKSGYSIQSVDHLVIEVSDQENIAILGAAALYYDAQEIRNLKESEKKRKRAENALQVSEEKYFKLFNHIADPILIYDKETFRILDFNESVERVYGFSKSELKNMTPLDLHRPEEFEKVRKRLKIKNKDIPFTYTHVRKDGKQIFVEVLSDEIEYEGRPASLSIVRDITERIKAEQQLRESRNNLIKAMKETDNIMQNVEEGLFLLNSKFEIGSQYSKALDKIFRSEDLANINILDILEGKIPMEVLSNTLEYLQLMFDGSILEENIFDLNPLTDVEMVFEDSANLRGFSKYLTFKFRRILVNEEIVGLMATVNDITEQVQLSKKLEESQQNSKRQMEWLVNLLHVEPALIQEFIDSAQNELDEINVILKEESMGNNFQVVLDKIYRSVHLVKGNASLLDLSLFAGVAHQCEELINGMKKESQLNGKDFVALNFKISEMQQSIQEVKSLIEKISNIQSHFRPKRSYESEKLLNSIKNFINNLSKDAHKNVNFVLDNFDGMSIPNQYRLLVKDLLVQFARNSVSHGIEKEAERLKLKKSKIATIELTSRLCNGYFEFAFKDDGRGLQLKKLKQAAINSGKWKKSELDKWDNQKLAELIFEPGISTQETADLVAGRGIGMNIVKEKIVNHDGELIINHAPGSYCEFVIRLPIGDLKS